MFISNIHINNYRKFNSIDFTFNSELNFIVGKNNIGKTSILKLINNLLKGRSFEDYDFYDLDKEINIIMKIKLSDDEIGIFDDYFDFDNSNSITFIFSQKEPYSELKLSDKSSGEELSLGVLKKISFLYYDSMMPPEKSGNILNNNKSYSLIKYLLNKKLTNKKGLIQYDDLVEKELNNINNELIKIETLEEQNLKLSLESNNDLEQIKRVITLTNDENIGIENMGYGTQYSNMILLNIINYIIQIFRYKSNHKNKIFTDGEGKKYLNLILAVDEPEIHLHPHMQKRLVAYLYNIIKGENDGFNSLINYLFEEIDYVKGQIFIVTHSPYTMLDDYKTFIRMFNSSTGVCVKCGEKIPLELKSKEYNDLLKILPDLKRCLFSKVVLLVEGDTEVAAMKNFAKSLKIDLNKYEIEIINANGKDTIPKLSELFDKFAINNIPIFDKDDNNDKNLKYNSLNNVKFTEKKDFEADMISSLDFLDLISCIANISKDKSLKSLMIKYLSNSGKNQLKQKIVECDEDIKENKIIDICGEEILPQLKEDNQKSIYKELTKNKTFIKGYFISDDIDDGKIPKAYKEALEEAKYISVNYE